MKLIIIFMGFLIMAAFEKVECKGCFEYHLFPFSNLKMIWPEYLFITCRHIVVIAWATDIYLTERSNPLLIALLLIIGWYLDFVLRCSMTWFRIGTYCFSYVSFATLVFALTIINSQWKNSI